VNAVSARALGPTNRSSVLAGYRAGVAGRSWWLLVMAAHAVVGEEQPDGYLSGMLRAFLDGAATDLNAGAPPAYALGRVHASALEAGRFVSAAACRLDGETLTVAGAGLAHVMTLSPEPAVLLVPELLEVGVRPPVLRSALGARRTNPPQEVVARSHHALLVVGGDVRPDNLSSLDGLGWAEPDPGDRGGIAVDLRP
jgi:hypothetical protein